jgi:hypothetical protein
VKPVEFTAIKGMQEEGGEDRRGGCDRGRLRRFGRMGRIVMHGPKCRVREGYVWWGSHQWWM